MEIKDPVHGTIEFSDSEVALIENPFFQRLRNIKQLGFVEFSFPGATHNRYLHSIGTSFLAARAFDQIFANYRFSSLTKKWQLRQATKLAALLHDLGHGPLSHSTEEVMPLVRDLEISAYQRSKLNLDRRCTHEDYTIKIVCDSTLGQTLEKEFPDLRPLHVACLINKELACHDDFFYDDGINFRPLLSQLVSSELDADRMDYLARDSYFCGANYGKTELEWLINNMSYYQVGKDLQLAIDRRALYTFDDFLISRHHMFLMVYFHHKAIVYDEMLIRYLQDKHCTFEIPANINEYVKYTDDYLYQHLRTDSNPWAQRIAHKKPFQVLFEFHETDDNPRPLEMKKRLEENSIAVIHSNSVARLSKYHPSSSQHTSKIYVIDKFDRKQMPYPIENATKIFNRYEGSRRIERLYVASEDFAKALNLIKDL